MHTSAFTDRSYRVARDGHTVVCDTAIGRDDADALRDALARRRHERSVTVVEDADAALALRALVAIEDRLATTSAAADTALSVTRPEALTLCDVACAYVSERDGDEYQAPEERDRIARLRALTGPLMDCCSELAAAEVEALERALVA